MRLPVCLLARLVPTLVLVCGLLDVAIASTTTTTLPCAPLPDSDGDGIGDTCDPCTGPVVVTEATLKIRGLATPPGDDKLKFKGLMQLAAPFSPALDPLHKGVRILIQDANDVQMLDAVIPAGAFDPSTLRGWAVNPSGTVYKFKQLGKNSPLIDGIKNVTIRDLSIRSPGLIKFLVVGKNGSLPVSNIPVRATLVIDAPIAVTGQCGEATFPGPPPAPVCTEIGDILLCK